MTYGALSTKNPQNEIANVIPGSIFRLRGDPDDPARPEGIIGEQLKKIRYGDHTNRERMKEEMRIKILSLLIGCVICLLPLQVFAQCTEGNCTDGKGTMIFPDGKAKYVGEFKKTMRQGKGTMTFADTGTPGGQKQYEGQWKEDQPSGKGTLTFYDGRKFVGEWKSEIVGGFPVMAKSVIVSGRGTMHYPDGKKEAGEFINNQFIKKNK